MIRAALPLLLSCLASIVAAPDAAATQLDYTLYVLGIPMGDAALTVDLTSSAYRIDLGFHTTGLADMVANDIVREHTTGRFENGRPVPLEHGANSRQRGQDRLLAMMWHDGIPTVTAIEPPNDAEREDVPLPLRAHTIDALSSIALLLHQVALTGRCEASSRSYDGRRLQSFEARTAGEEDIPPSGRSSFSGRTLRCDFIDHTLAGFRLGSGRADDLREHQSTVWLAQVAGAGLLPVRASVETRWFGNAMIYLTSASR